MFKFMKKYCKLFFIFLNFRKLDSIVFDLKKYIV